MPSQKITADTVCAGLREGMTVAEMADRFGVSIRTMRRRMAEIRKADPAAMPLARELGGNTRTTAPARRSHTVRAEVIDRVPDEALIPPQFDDATSDHAAARAFLRWALRTPLAVDPSKIAAARVLLADGDPPEKPAEDHAAILEQVVAATASAEGEPDLEREVAPAHVVN